MKNTITEKSNVDSSAIQKRIEGRATFEDKSGRSLIPGETKVLAQGDFNILSAAYKKVHPNLIMCTWEEVLKNRKENEPTEPEDIK